MTFQVVERDGIVVDNTDPLLIGRVRVFIYGVHDITGVKTPFENLPWAYCADGISVTIPPIWSSVRVKYRFSLGQAFQAFARQDAIEWHSPSPFRKLAPNRDPRLFLKYDSTQQKFLNQTPIDLDSIKFKISELERLKQEKESQRDVLVQTLKDIENDSLLDPLRKKEEDAIKEATEQLPEANKVLKEQQTKLDNLLITQQQEELKFSLDNINAFEDYYNQNLVKTYGDLIELNNNNKSVYNELLDKFNAETNNNVAYGQLKDTHIQQKEELQFSVNNASNTLNDLSRRIKAENSDYKNRQKSLTNDKIAIQKDLEAKIIEIQDIDKQLNELTSTASTGANAALTFEASLLADSRISRYNKDNGYVFDNQDRVIGIWTGSFFYIPGYAGQPGIPIPERYQEGLIDYNSHLVARNSNGSESGSSSSIINARDSKAITKSNNNKEFSCDISAETRLKILTKRSQVANAIRWLRDQILALFPLDGNSATSQWVKATAIHLAALLKDIQKFLNFVNNVLLEIVRITTYIRSVINWILSLPARILALLANCITHFLNSISDTFSEAISTDGIGGGTSVSFAEVTALVSQAQSTFQTATETVSIATQTYVEIKSIEGTFEKV